MIFITCTTCGLTQSTFQLSIDNNDTTSQNFIRHSITEGSNGDIYALGTVIPDNVYSKCRLIKISDDGNIIWDTTYTHTPSNEFFPELMPTADGGIILASDSYSYPLQDNDTITDILVWKISPEGEIEWENVLSASGFYDMSTTKDGGFILVGIIPEAFYYQGRDLITYKIDSLGNVLWSTQLGQQTGGFPYERERPISIKEIDGQIYVCGYHNRDGWIELDGIMYALDSQGNLVWDIFIQNTPENGDVRINSVFKFNGKLYFVDSQGIKEFDPDTGNYWNAPDFANLRFSEMGYNYSQPCGTGDMSVLNIESGGSYALQVYDSLTEPYYEKSIPQITDFFTEFISTKDGGHLALTGNGNMVITKMDCLGNVGFWSEECAQKVTEEFKILLYPNPVQNDLTIEAAFEIEQIWIYGSDGRAINYQVKCGCNSQSIGIQHLASGVYQVRVDGQEQTVISRFVKT